jgi:saccharopine dehydrogenase-like NADP-dependent oxidoreductase
LSAENLDKIKQSCPKVKTKIAEFSDDFKPIFSETGADLVICLLPPRWCEPVMRACLEFGAHMVHPSYVDDGQKKLKDAIRESGKTVIGEMGLDPGIDHMSAARGAAEAKRDGFIVESYRSSCGALPAVEANTNPWGYKLSWAPESLIGTFLRPAKGLLNGDIYDFPDGKAFKNTEIFDVPGLPVFELYPNGDALPYRELYSIPEVKTLYRGTLRYVGWSETIDVMNDIGLTSHEKTDTKGQRFSWFVSRKICAT